MSYQPGDAVKRVQKLLETLEEKQHELVRAESDYKRSEIKCEQDIRQAKDDHKRAEAMLAAAHDRLAQVRKQIMVEIQKVDPGILQRAGAPTSLAG